MKIYIIILAIIICYLTSKIIKLKKENILLKFSNNQLLKTLSENDEELKKFLNKEEI